MGQEVSSLYLLFGIGAVGGGQWARRLIVYIDYLIYEWLMWYSNPGGKWDHVGLLK